MMGGRSQSGSGGCKARASETTKQKALLGPGGPIRARFGDLSALLPGFWLIPSRQPRYDEQYNVDEITQSYLCW